jgi:hypothetical protein
MSIPGYGQWIKDTNANILTPRSSELQQNCHLDRSVPGFPASLRWTRPRVRLSLKERRMMFLNATNFNRKSGVAQWRDLRFLF